MKVHRRNETELCETARAADTMAQEKKQSFGSVMEKGTGFFRFNMRRPVPKIGMNGQLFFFFKQKLQTIDTRFNGWAVPTNPVTSDPETFQEKENHSGRYRFVECSILNEGLFI